jgi:fucose permease
LLQYLFVQRVKSRQAGTSFPTSPMDNNENSPLLDDHSSLSNTAHHAQTRPSSKIDRSLALQIAAAMLSFSTLGLFNSSIGAVLPSISHHYTLTDLHVSLLFLASPFGYIFAAQFSNAIHYRFGQRGIALIAPIFQITSTLLIATHPRFGWILVAFAIQGIGMGLLDGSWCAWAGSMEKANTISGLLHGSYSVGGAAGPFLVTVLTTNRRPWYVCLC